MTPSKPSGSPDFLLRPQQEHKAPQRAVRHLPELTAARPAAPGAHPLPSEPPCAGRNAARTLRVRRTEGQALDIQDGGREPGVSWPGPRQAGRQAESRQGRSTAVYWQHKQRRRRWWWRRQAPSRVRGGGAPAGWGGPGAAPGLCQRLALGDLPGRGTASATAGPGPGRALSRPPGRPPPPRSPGPRCTRSCARGPSASRSGWPAGTGTTCLRRSGSERPRAPAPARHPLLPRPPPPSPKELRKSAIFLMELVITSMYSRLAQSWWISRCTGSSCTDMAAPAAAAAPARTAPARGYPPAPAPWRRPRGRLRPHPPPPPPQGCAGEGPSPAALSSSLALVSLPLGSCGGGRRQSRTCRPPPRSTPPAAFAL